MNHFDVTIQFQGREVTLTIVALTPGKARAEAWRQFSEPWPCTFREFMGISRVRRCPTAPSSDGYASVERQYGKKFRVGDRVRMNEGEGRFAGTEGVIVYPGPSTCYAHVWVDGAAHSVVVHPLNVDVI